MRAFTVNKYSKKEPLHLTDVSEPKVNENEVLVKIHSAGVNLLDSLIRNGEFKIFLPYKTPFVNGHDMAGIVTKVGAKVSKFKVGDEVYARPADFKIGTFAEYISVNENDLALKPKNISMEEASSIPLVGLTSWQALVEIAKLKKGQKVFIQAGSGGVGTFAIQLAKHIGAFVATTTSSSNTELVKNLGADLIIDYKTQDFATILKDYDVVLHSNREAKVLENSLKILKPGGTLISLTGPPTGAVAKNLGLGWHFQIIMNLLSLSVRRKAKKLGVNFNFLFMKADGKALSEITKLIEAEKIRPIIDKVFPFEQTNEALTYVESGRSKGKVVIKVQ
ncbi:NADPH:quinone reductase-like Zn-dependent oxidoreductase [Flavobacterium croceum DSM 17960]|uniref:NADPH:quinone reductase-like Zn-dependent oxidoreductase n=1 Tax=Flavobacterium croceum DSM 17960 TaxID=1121886 RepID=A0A2S4N4X6_9FLAO|nr:NADP-dependent oxidoreductase [Flavobacterium croceum]POS00745.1 NADPH:quinone reductase-like Zn-dependent oxidoreductase [Flavobacterium croceum DSM 17960]